MTNDKTADHPTAVGTQLSPLSDVIIRLDEIRRRLGRAWVSCGSEAQRNLIAQAEQEVTRGQQLLEAELNRCPQDPGGPKGVAPP